MSEQTLEKVRKRVFPFRFQPPPEYSDERWFSGLLGLWAWPLVNLVLSLAEKVRAKSRPSFTPYPTQVFPRVATRRTEYVRNNMGRIIEKLEEVEF